MRRSAALLIFDPLNRLRPSIWDPIARELGVSWREAEAIHWNIGEAGLAPTALTALSEPSMEKRESSKTSSNESPDASGVKTKPSSKPVLRLRFPAPNEEIAEDRAQHFEPTRPSKLQPEEFVKLKRTETTVDQAQPYDPIRSSQAGALSSSLHTTPAVNLTLEGRRQAQAAGDKLRARRTPSRHRKAAIAVNDHTSHQNRWASYKSPSSTFLPQESINIPQGFDGPSLTSEGRRQAQVAGDKLRCRTNPIRHSRPSRGSISDHGISKNRWSTYGPRATRSDERQDMQAEPKEKAPSGDTKEQEPSEQPSLLEVFEAELAKKISIDTLQDNARTIVPEAAAATVSISETTPQLNDSSNISASTQSESPQESIPLLDGLKMINDHLEGLTVGDENMSQGFPGAIGQGFHAAIGSVSTFMRGVTSGLQEASNLTRQAAERTREADFRIIDDTILGLRAVAGDMTALGQEILPKRPETSQPREEATVGSTASSESLASATVPEEDTISSSESKAAPPEGNNLAEDSQAPSTAGPPRSISATKPTAGPKTIKIGQGRSPRFVSDIPVTVTCNSPPDSRRMSRNLGMNRVPRYHKPGPIHLPHHAPLAQPTPAVETQGSATRTGHVDHLRRYHSTENTDEADINQSTTLPAAAARFPTLAQFEGRNFTSNVPFPPLPSMSMEPLVPLRANSRSDSEKPDEKSQLLSEEHVKSQPEASADTSMTHRVIHFSHFMDPGTNRWLSPHPSQDPPPMQIQDTPLPNPSENGGAGTNHALEDYHWQLRLLEQQNKKRLLMAQQEQDRIWSDRAKTNSALASGMLILDAKDEQQAPSNIAQRPVSFLPHTLNTNPNHNHTLQENQMQLTPRQQSTLRGPLKQQDSAPLPRPLEEPEALSLNEPSAGLNGSSAVHDHQTSLQEIIADQIKKRQSLEEQEEQVIVPDDVKVPGAFPSGKHIKRNDLVGQPEENGPFRPAFNPETGLYDEDTRNSLATHPDPWYSPSPSTMNKAESSSRLSSAARLAEPFDPLEAEPSARSHLTEGIRRNATVAGTDSRHNARRRRPYSEAFDGTGRVEWDKFLHHPQAPQSTKSQFTIHPSDCHPLSKRSWVNDKESASKPEFRALGSKFSFEDPDDDWHWTNPAIRERAQASRLASEYYDHGESWAVDPCEVDQERYFNVDERKSSPPPRVTAPRPDSSFNNHREHKSLHIPRNKKSSKPRAPARASTISFKDWDERRKIYDCVSRLRDLGFENTEDDDGPESRLLQYASAAGGDLVAAIDMIDEEQRAYKEREKDALEFIDSI